MTREQRAVQLVERAICAYRKPVSTVVQLALAPTLAESIERVGTKTADDYFLAALKAWLIGGRRLQQAGVCDDVAWYFSAKPWLRTLVGWNATSELGRCAGSRGYTLLSIAWYECWLEADSRSGALVGKER